nr:MAG TPA: hypothetical protein [Caudoviricetes sp.]
MMLISDLHNNHLLTSPLLRAYFYIRKNRKKERKL